MSSSQPRARHQHDAREQSPIPQLACLHPAPGLTWKALELALAVCHLMNRQITPPDHVVAHVNAGRLKRLETSCTCSRSEFIGSYQICALVNMRTATWKTIRGLIDIPLERVYIDGE
jgi:hypothetical protein